MPSFAQLSPAAQEKVIEGNRYIQLEDTEWYEDAYEKWTNTLTELGFRNINIFFTGFCSQGDGACFEGDILFRDYLKTFDKGKAYLGKLRLLGYRDLGKQLTDGSRYITIKHTGRYYHERSVSVGIAFDYPEEDSEVEKELYQLLDEDEVKEWVAQISRQIYAELNSTYDYLQSDKSLEEYFVDSEMRFDEEGNTLKFFETIRSVE